jgi:glycosyltransferase involved in cell wall biosynthesis
MTPLVSILLPCYNSAATLPWALASLLAQTYVEWECVFVDDGSTDHPETVLGPLSDKRIRYFRLPKNSGRGAARRFALERTHGKYICMLDADDWLYPWKISSQIDFLHTRPGLVLVSTGMAIINANNNIVGVRCRSSNRDAPTFCRTAARPVVPVVSFPPTMVRSDAARQISFDPGLAAVEDLDFLMRLLINQSYGILPTVTYAYRESMTQHRILQDHHLFRMLHWRYVDRYPAMTCVEILNSLAKSAIYRVGFAVGQGDWLKRRRSVDPTPDETREFHLAREVVSMKMEQIFGSSVPVGRNVIGRSYTCVE